MKANENIAEMSKKFVRIILPKYYTFINDTSFTYIYIYSLLKLLRGFYYLRI